MQKGRTVWRLASDVRGEGATILLRLWDALGLPEDATTSAGAIARFGVGLLFIFSNAD